MQVKPIAAPVEARASQSSPFFLAGGSEIASFAQTGTDAGSSVWVALPFGREMLAAAAMSPDNDSVVSVMELSAMSADEFRAWVLGAFLHTGSGATIRSAGSGEFRSGFADDLVLAEFYALLCSRLDADLFAGTAVPNDRAGQRCDTAQDAA